MRGEDMIRKAAITLLSTLSVGAFLLTFLSYCGCPGFRWTVYNGQADPAVPAEHVTLMFWDLPKSDPAVLTICYRQLPDPDQSLKMKYFDWGIVDVLALDSSVYTGVRRHLWLDWFITIPFWLMGVLLGAYPLVAFIRGPYLRHRRRKKGLCLKCGYNLTGNVSGVCPECGERI